MANKPAVLSDGERREIERQLENIRTLHRQTPASLVSVIAGILSVLALFAGRAPASLLAGWVGCFLLLSLARLRLYLSYGKGEVDASQFLMRWRRRWNFLTVLAGLFWGMVVVLFYDYGDTLQKIGVIMMVYGYTLASIQILANQTAVFAAFSLAALGPTILQVMWGHGLEGAELAFIICIFYGMTTLMGRSYKKVYDHLVDLKLTNEKLVAGLRDETEVAQQAWQQAEASIRSKSQFLAAASHDLRQPVHAVSLYTDTLRDQSRRGGAIGELIDSIRSSVVALDGLFSELLDVAKLDAGVVTSVPRDIEMGGLFARVEVHARPLAFEKGLDLKFRGAHYVAFVDPTLLERVLRNLVSNAIRYSEEGGVLVSCRQRDERLLLQVWDSGIGITEDNREHIFEEFYQAVSPPGLSPPARRGMGLGLAIVRRLVNLMDVPLDLRSRPGHGTVFSVLLPLGHVDQVERPPPDEGLQLSTTLEGRLVVVVEDDPDVRKAMHVVLEDWEAEVVTFDSVDACRDWIARSDEHGLVPDLAVVDYALGRGVNGIDAVRMLRARFDPDLPALVVTGALTAEVDRDPDRKTLHVMTKPVLPQKLRSMITFKLRRDGGDKGAAE